MDDIFEGDSTGYIRQGALCMFCWFACVSGDTLWFGIHVVLETRFADQAALLLYHC